MYSRYILDLCINFSCLSKICRINKNKKIKNLSTGIYNLLNAKKKYKYLVINF